MAFYTPTAGIITNIDYFSVDSSQSAGCTVLISLQSEDQGMIDIQLPSNVYVLNLHPFQVGDRATFFYSSSAPVPMIYPPRYRAVAAAYTPHGVTAVLDTFDSQLTNSDHTLTLTPGRTTPVTLPNGQTFAGNAGGKLILATYTASTRSIPAQAVPEQMVVFCQNS